MPVKPAGPRVLRRLRGSEGEIAVMELNNNKWLAAGEDKGSRFSLGEIFELKVCAKYEIVFTLCNQK